MSTSSAESGVAPRLGDLFLASFHKLTSVQPGERVLDLATLDGAAALEAARRTGEDGELLLLDRDATRLERVLAAVRSEGAIDARTQVSDAATLPSLDSYWDVITCHLGFAQLADPEATLKDTIRVLRPVGRIGVSTWGERDRCPLLTVFLDAIAPFVPSAPEVARAPFRYSESGKLARTLA